MQAHVPLTNARLLPSHMASHHCSDFRLPGPQPWALLHPLGHTPYIWAPLPTPHRYSAKPAVLMEVPGPHASATAAADCA